MTSAEFQAEINQYRVPVIPRDEHFLLKASLAAVRESCRRSRADGHTAEEVAAKSKRLITEVEGEWTAQRYPKLDLAFTEREEVTFWVRRQEEQVTQVELVAEPDEHSVALKVPRYLLVWKEFARWQELYRDPEQSHEWIIESPWVELPKLPKAKNRQPKRSARVSTRIPSGVTEEHFAQLRQAIVHALMFRLLAFERGFEVEFPDPCLKRWHGNHVMVGLLWAPTREAWSLETAPAVPPGDPALLLRIGSGDAHLVGFFDTPQEYPLEYILREFSTGPAPQRL